MNHPPPSTIPPHRQPSAAALWRSFEHNSNSPEFQDFLAREFPQHASEWLESPQFNRRRFLQLMGASLSLAGLTNCTRQPLEKIVPYVEPPEQLILGQPLFFATSSSFQGFARGLLVESHEGRPTKIEGNPDHPASLGATDVFGQAALLDLYDPDRAAAASNSGSESTWEQFLSSLNAALHRQIPLHGRGLRILTETVTSPTLHWQMEQILKKFPEARWHQFEPVLRDSIKSGARSVFGKFVETLCHFEKARLILSLDSDFLTSHPFSLHYARAFSRNRRAGLDPASASRLYVLEPTPTITGSVADHRFPLGSEQIHSVAVALANALQLHPSDATQPPLPNGSWQNLISDLKKSAGESIILAGPQQPPAVHAVVHRLNAALGNYGKTISIIEPAEAQPVLQLESLQQLNAELHDAKTEILLIVGGNPVFNAPADLDFASGLSTVPFRAHLTLHQNETSELCHWVIPAAHFLEDWSDLRAFDGTSSIVQPLIEPLYNGKSPHEFLQPLLQQPGIPSYEIVRGCWRDQQLWPDFEKGWRIALHDGLIAGTAHQPLDLPLTTAAIPPPQTSLTLSSLTHPNPISTALELVFRPDPAAWDGQFANNAWLQELPRPLTKIAWDNPLLISPALAQQLQLASGDIVELRADPASIQAPIFILPGQAPHTITAHFGNGRSRGGKIASGTGFNFYPLRLSIAPWRAADVHLVKTGGNHPIATTQHHHALGHNDRQIWRGATLADFLRNPNLVQQQLEIPAAADTLYSPQEHPNPGYRWAMAIDLTACIGCNACVIACQAENNIPVVGKSQVALGREMHWIRIDTYFQGHPDDPQFHHQPVPCMHCENAPCELVCPVAATVHDHEGLNVQVYNRCIGTRYCSNNCPYKVRRFNFLQYADQKTPSLKPMRNPNVTVRSRGVMEKCTYCVQRISAARIQSKIQDRSIRDGEIRTACQQACPAEAIIFGNLNDPESKVSTLKRSPLNFSMLGQLNTRPRTTYLAELRNPHPDPGKSP